LRSFQPTTNRLASEILQNNKNSGARSHKMNSTNPTSETSINMSNIDLLNKTNTKDLEKSLVN